MFAYPVCRQTQHPEKVAVQNVRIVKQIVKTVSNQLYWVCHITRYIAISRHSARQRKKQCTVIILSLLSNLLSVKQNNSTPLCTNHEEQVIESSKTKNTRKLLSSALCSPAYKGVHDMRATRQLSPDLAVGLSPSRSD